MSALCFVPRISFLAVVPGSDVTDALDSLFYHAGIDHQRRGCMLEAGHDLGEVRKGNSRTNCFAVVADQDRSLVVEGKGSLYVVVLFEVAFVVEGVDRCQRLADILG